MTSHDAFLARVRPFVEAGVLDAADVFAVALAAPRFGEDDVERMLGLAFAARAPRVSHPGVDLAVIARSIDEERLFSDRGTRDAAGTGEDELDADDEDDDVGGPAASAAAPAVTTAAPSRAVDVLSWPADAQSWATHTLTSPMVGAPDDSLKPFVVQRRDGAAPLLLTRRMFVEQQRVAAALAARAPLDVPDAARIEALDETLRRLFPDEPDGEAARSVRLAATKRLALVVGGPGTGKTFSVTRLLAALLGARAAASDDDATAIALAAPTGKAAARMREAIREATARDARPFLDVTDDVRARLQALPATTLHRLVGVRPDGSSRHDRKNPLPAQLVIVDEVSMVDLTMMRRLLEAVHPEARLVLLGDRDQLASVEAGCVLGDLVPAGAAGPLAANIVAFSRSRRFESAPDIALVAACLQSYATAHPDVPRDDAERARSLALAVFRGQQHASREQHRGVRVVQHGAPAPTPRGARPTPTQLDELARPYVGGIDDLGRAEGEAVRPRLPGYAALLREALLTRERGGADEIDDPAWQRRLLGAFDHYRVLAVHRRGPLGVKQLERELGERVRAFVRAGRRRSDGVGHGHWVGRPVLVTENAYDVGLMNGDVGIVLPLSTGVAAVFPHESPGSVRSVSLARLPPHEGALAMTVHKSQGSQFDRVALVLAGRSSPIQTRELVYTGVTRARMQLGWLGDPDELREALARQVVRASGLPQLIETAFGDRR
jgi:exodeoxyribonuclease V alpha subunit